MVRKCETGGARPRKETSSAGLSRITFPLVLASPDVRACVVYEPVIVFFLTFYVVTITPLRSNAIGPDSS